MVYVIGTLILLLLICFVIVFFKYTKLKEAQNSIDVCYNKINETLEKKLDIVKEALNTVRNEKLKNSFSYDESADVYEKEKSLYDIGFELNKYSKQSKSKKLKEIIKSLNEMEEELDGLKDYYNSNLLSYNDIYMNKYFNKIFKLLKFNSYRSFRIRKIEDYEIFKN